jgi:hypothetical protein
LVIGPFRTWPSKRRAFGRGGAVDNGDAGSLTPNPDGRAVQRRERSGHHPGARDHNSGDVDLGDVDLLSNCVSGAAGSIGGGIADNGRLRMADTNVGENRALPRTAA